MSRVVHTGYNYVSRFPSTLFRGHFLPYLDVGYIALLMTSGIELGEDGRNDPLADRLVVGHELGTGTADDAASDVFGRGQQVWSK